MRPGACKKENFEAPLYLIASSKPGVAQLVATSVTRARAAANVSNITGLLT
jgi:hypothetical protein